MGVTRSSDGEGGVPSKKGWWHRCGCLGGKYSYATKETTGQRHAAFISGVARAPCDPHRCPVGPGTRHYSIAISEICRFADELSNVRGNTETTPNGPATL